LHVATPTISYPNCNFCQARNFSNHARRVEAGCTFGASGEKLYHKQQLEQQLAAATIECERAEHQHRCLKQQTGLSVRSVRQ